MLANRLHTTRVPLLAAAAAAALLALSGCAGASAAPTSSDSPAASDSFNAADVAFAQMMIAHHEQAVEMSDEVLGKGDIDKDTVDLATDIKAAQEPEIQKMESWLNAWGAEKTMAGMDHGTDGMMSEDDLSALEDATGSDAARLFLQQMTIHHEGAIAMARTELQDGKNSKVKGLAEDIVAAQEAEIQDMKDLLAAG